MYDVLTIAALADELRETVLDGRIQRIGLIDRLSVAMEIYSRGERRGFEASADSQLPRALLLPSMPSTDPNLITPFGLMLRKYVRNGVLVGVEQPAMERMLRLSIAKRIQPHNDQEDESEDADDVWSDEGVFRTDLYIEIMGRHSNLILVDADGLVMESAKRVTPQMSRVRPVQPRRPYELPPPVERPDPRRVTSASVEALLANAKSGAKLREVLVSGLRAVSSQIAREIAFRTFGNAEFRVRDVDRDSWQLLASHIRGLFEPMLSSSWNPTTYARDDEIFAFSPMPLHHLEQDSEAVARNSISEAAAFFDPDDASIPQSHTQRRAQLQAIISNELIKVRARLASLEQQAGKVEDAEDWRTAGELIFAYLWKIQPGDSELEVDGRRISLDPALSAKENAQLCFDRYRRAQRASEHLPGRIDAANQEVAYLQQLQVQIEQAAGFAELEALRAELYDLDGVERSQSSRQPKPKKTGGRSQSVWSDADGNAIFVGRSGKDNDQVTFTVAGAEDTWLHARGYPGSHVIVKWARPVDEDPESVIERAAQLAAWYSSARASGRVEVDVTKRKHVRKIKGAGPGMVTYRNERTILVEPREGN